MSAKSPSSPKPRVAVVFGGRSSEHEISCLTAGRVLAAIDRDAYDVVLIGISAEGRWVLAPDEPERLAVAAGRLPRVDNGGTAVALAGDPTARELIVSEPGAVPKALGEVDVVFPLLHGLYGEDGTIQGLLELAGVPYVGSAVLASAVSMDKAYMKLVLAGRGLPVGPHVVVLPREWERDPAAVRETVAGLGWPVFVKPARAGSSVGVSKVRGPDELDAAIEAAREHDPKVIVETGLDAREIECGVLEGLDGAPPDTSVLGEVHVRGDHEFYDFEAKYLDELTHFDVPADLPDETAAELRRLAVATFEAVGAEGLARVDFFLTRDGTPVINEINTMPGFTPASLFPQLWEASGLDYPALVDRLIKTALNRPGGLR